MQIGIDAGALTPDPSAQYGTATFTRELIRAFAQYGTHDYHAYTFSQATGHGHVSMIRLPRRGFFRVFMHTAERAHPSDVFLGINQVFPSTRARLFGFSHGLAALTHPHAYPEQEVGRQLQQVDALIARSERIFTTSRRITQALKKRGATIPIHTLPMGLPSIKLQPDVEKEPYIATIGMNHPIKRIDELVRIYRNLRRARAIPDTYRLILIGPHERHHNPRNGIIATGFLTPDAIPLWLQKSRLYVCTSEYESFHFPYLEAAQAGCINIGLTENVIPELRDVVHTASNMAELETLITTASTHPPQIQPISQRKLQDQFDWSKTVAAIERHI